MYGIVECTGVWSPLRSGCVEYELHWSVQEYGAHLGVGVWSMNGTGVYRCMEPIEEWECGAQLSVEYEWDCGVYRSMEPIEEW